MGRQNAFYAVKGNIQIMKKPRFAYPVQGEHILPVFRLQEIQLALGVCLEHFQIKQDRARVFRVQVVVLGCTQIMQENHRAECVLLEHI